MHIRYIAENEKATIVNNKGDSKTVNNHEDLNDILKSENKVELLTGKIHRLKTDLIESKRDLLDIFTMMSNGCLVSIVPLAIFLASLEFGIIGNISTLKEVLGSITIFFTIQALLNVGPFIEYKKKKKEQKIIESEIEFLEQEMGKEKLKLRRLNKKSHKSIKNTKKRKVIELEPWEEKKRLEHKLKIIISVMKDFKNYLKEYQKGSLDNELKEEYYFNSKDRDFAYNYLKEQINKDDKKKKTKTI